MKTWEDQYKAGKLAANTTPWISLSGKSDAFRQGFYSVTSEHLAKADYTHVVEYEAWVCGHWLAKRFRTTADAVNLHAASLATKGFRNIFITEMKK